MKVKTAIQRPINAHSTRIHPLPQQGESPFPSSSQTQEGGFTFEVQHMVAKNLGGCLREVAGEI